VKYLIIIIKVIHIIKYFFKGYNVKIIYVYHVNQIMIKVIHIIKYFFKGYNVKIIYVHHVNQILIKHIK